MRRYDISFLRAACNNVDFFVTKFLHDILQFQGSADLVAARDDVSRCCFLLARVALHDLNRHHLLPLQWRKYNFKCKPVQFSVQDISVENPPTRLFALLPTAVIEYTSESNVTYLRATTCNFDISETKFLHLVLRY